MWIIIIAFLFLPGCLHCCSAFFIDGRFPTNRSLVVHRKRCLPAPWRLGEHGPMIPHKQRVPDSSTDVGLAASANVKWHTMWKRLQNYQRIKVPKDYPPDPALGRWVMNQRACYQTLWMEQRQQLKDLGFTARLRAKCNGHRKEPWDAMFHRLEE
jgi:Helicase associated domain